MAFYTRIHEEHWLRDRLEDGRIVILEDESIWEVHPSDRPGTVSKPSIRRSALFVPWHSGSGRFCSNSKLPLSRPAQPRSLPVKSQTKSYKKNLDLIPAYRPHTELVLIGGNSRQLQLWIPAQLQHG